MYEIYCVFFRKIRIFGELEWDVVLLIVYFFVKLLIIMLLNLVILLRWKLMKCLEFEKRKF